MQRHDRSLRLAAGDTELQGVPARKHARRTTHDDEKESGNYPIPDRGHAISAKRLGRKNRKEGNLTKEEFERIERKADKVLETDG